MQKYYLLLYLLLLPLTAIAANPFEGGGQPLHPDKAFALSTSTVDANTLEASWNIADDYYMYRRSFKFEVLDKNITLSKPVIPAGIIKYDKTFNEKLKIFKKKVVIKLPFSRNNSKASSARVRITSQGCNDPIGLCYTPVKKEVTFKLLPAVVSAAKADTPKSLKDLQKTISNDSTKPDYLPADKAFVVSAKPIARNQFRLSLGFEKTYYLYKKDLRIRLISDGADDGTDVRLGQYKLPRGKKTVDKFIGETVTYNRKFSMVVPIIGQNKQPYQRRLTVRYVGCKEDAICYPPNTKVFQIKADANGKLDIADVTPTKPMADDAVNGTPATASTAGTWAFIKALSLAFIIGLALTFTPCVLPMIPILSSIIVGQGEKAKDKSAMHGGALAISYVLGTSVLWTAAGVFAGATGRQFHAYFQNIWFLGGASVLFAILALSMFGFYNIQMPQFIQSHMQQRSHKMQGGTLFGVFVLGIFSSMVVGACVSPLLIFALGAALQTADPVLGGATMFALSLGMGGILIAIGFGANWLLPKAGVWMDAVKHFFGVLLLAVSVYLLGQIPEYEIPVLYLWAPLLVIYSIYLGAFLSLPEGASGWRLFSKGLGMLLFAWGVLALIGAFSGSRDITRPVDLSRLGGGTTAQVKSVDSLFVKVKDVPQLNQQLEQAQQAGKPVLVDYYASWCQDCKTMEASTFRDPQVQGIMAQFVAIKIDVTKVNGTTTALKKRFKVFGPPATILIDNTGKIRKDLSFYGFRSARDFIAILRKV